MLADGVPSEGVSTTESVIAVAGASILEKVIHGRPRPMGEGVFGVYAAQLFALLETTDQRQILQVLHLYSPQFVRQAVDVFEMFLKDGLSTLTYLVRKDCDQLLGW